MGYEVVVYIRREKKLQFRGREIETGATTSVKVTPLDVLYALKEPRYHVQPDFSDTSGIAIKRIAKLGNALTSYCLFCTIVEETARRVD